MDNELLLFDRLNVIKDTINKYGEENFYLSFSGGKDSTVLHHLLDEALPGNKIPRVFLNTGIEYIYMFVKEMAEHDDRFVMIRPEVNIKRMLEKDGYPFKSKEFSTKLDQWQKGSRAKSVVRYKEGDTQYDAPKKLKWMFSDECTLKVSAYCCHRLKKEPAKRYSKESGRNITITGMRKDSARSSTSIVDDVLAATIRTLFMAHGLMQCGTSSCCAATTRRADRRPTPDAAKPAGY